MLNILKFTLRSTFIYSIGNFSTKLIGLILIPLYTTKLSVAEYGMLGMLEVTAQVLTAIIGLSLYNAFFRWYWDKDYEDRQKSMFFTILVSVTTVWLLMNLALFPLRGNLSEFLLDTPGQGYLITLILLISGMDALALIVSTLVRLQERPGFYSVLQVARTLTNLAFTVYFIAYRGKSIEGIYEAQLIGNALFYLLSARFIWKNSQARFEWHILPGMMRFSIPLLFTSIASVILTISDRYVLRFISDLEYVGIYSLGFKIANVLRVFIITSVNLAIQPVIYRMIDQPGSKRFYSKIMTYFSYGLMICALGLSLFGREIIKFLAQNNPDYWEAFGIVPILSLAIFFSMLRDVSLTGINITRKTGVNARSILIVSLFNIGLNILLIPSLGYHGAAIATLISQALYFIIIYRAAQKYYPIRYEISKVMIITGVGIFIYLVSTFTDPMSLGPRLGLKILLLLLFPVVLHFFRFYEKVELERIRGFWNKWKDPGKWRKNLSS